MCRKHLTHNIGAKTSRSGGTGEDVRVEKHPHETSVNTSSSVRYPRASANGMIFRLSVSN